MDIIAEKINNGDTVLGLEFGSTRIKAVLIDDTYTPVASGDYEWENRLENGIWTYSMDDILTGLTTSYANLKTSVYDRYKVELKNLSAIGFSAMMHGYLAFDKDGRLLVPFRTWRNGMTGQASEILSGEFSFNIPQRWSIAHLYQAILNGEEHVERIDYITTLAGYIHWQLTGERVLGVGDASGMFPIDSTTGDYDSEMLKKFDALIADKGFSWRIKDILPKVLKAGESAGELTPEGAKMLDKSGILCPGIKLCPPEGDAGTGMVATCSVAKRTGNVSAGTSIFGMIVLDEKLTGVYPEIDMVTTPDGSPVAMVHANNCTSDLNAWVNIFDEYNRAAGISMDRNRLYEILYCEALEGDSDCGGVLSYGYLSGENITDVSEGRPMVIRTPKSKFTLANMMRSHLFTAFGALRLGMDILQKKEAVKIDKLFGHGGMFKTKGVGQRFLAAAVNTPVTVMETAGEGGPWGMALLASYMCWNREGLDLQSYLSQNVFKNCSGISVAPDERDVQGYDRFIEQYVAGLPVERAAGGCVCWKN